MPSPYSHHSIQYCSKTVKEMTADIQTFQIYENVEQLAQLGDSGKLYSVS